MSAAGLPEHGELQVTCPRCASEKFHVFYDRNAMGHNVRCAGCGDSIGDLR